VEPDARQHDSHYSQSMSGLRKLPGYRRSPAGLEWRIWKRLPMVLGWGTGLPLLGLAAVGWMSPSGATVAEDPALLLWTYQLLGLILLHWTLMFTLAIGCGIVMLMKGPAYGADTYPHLP
jgi:hypothetical protein